MLEYVKDCKAKYMKRKELEYGECLLDCSLDPFKGFMDAGVIGPDGFGDYWEGSKGKEDSCALGRDLPAVGG